MLCWELFVVCYCKVFHCIIKSIVGHFVSVKWVILFLFDLWGRYPSCHCENDLNLASLLHFICIGHISSSEISNGPLL